ncbi:hypothetical protein BLNAU_10547 [Blattamonas nauphoetae]|uniref:Uncharacterized protein n=1 Tax=Blattamonas nauphoetae TaxID=2049346 RepID=A0ABQ9XS53_9EUKA|nr:hypothetical protein BLNAU_10547 [Blattamonas nauphoetae]
MKEAENNPAKQIDDLLALFSDPNEHHPQPYQQSLVYLLRRHLNHISNAERNDLLTRFGAALSQHNGQDIDIESLLTIVSSDEDVITLFHTSGLSHSILRQVQLEPTEHRHLLQLARISEIYPLVSIPTLSNDLSSLFRTYLCEPLSYLENDHPNRRSSISGYVLILSNDERYRYSTLQVFEEIMCNEFLACAIIGCGEAISETILTHFPTYVVALSNQQRERPRTNYDYRLFQKIIEISQNETDPLERITSFINKMSGEIYTDKPKDQNRPMNILSLCLRYVATFLSAHPDLIDSFIKRITLSSALSKTIFRNDQQLSLLSTLSQSSSPLFPHGLEPLHQLPLTLHAPRSFTDPASSFIRLASTNPAIFGCIVEKYTGHIVDVAVSTAVWTVRVVSVEPSEPHCLDFGRATQNLVVLLKSIAEMKLDLKLPSSDSSSLPSSLLSLLVLCAASTCDELSTAAVSVFSHQFDLTTPYTEALLFTTPTTFPVGDAFTPHHSQMLGENHTKGPCRSICAEAGRCIVLKSHSDVSEADDDIDFARLVELHFAGSLVNAFHSATSLPHSFPFFSPELSRLSQQPSVWNDPIRPSPLASLTMLADLEIRRSFWVPRRGQLVRHPDEEGRDIAFLHLFPFLKAESQAMFLSSFRKFYKSKPHDAIISLDRVVKYLFEMSTANSYNTHIALLKELRKVARFLSDIHLEMHSFEPDPTNRSPFEISILEKLKTAKGEERWRLVTQLVVVSNDAPDLAEELMKAENDAQALLILSVHKIRSTPRFDFHLDTNVAAFDRVVEFAGHANNLPVVSATLTHVVDTIERLDHSSLAVQTFTTERRQALNELVLNILRAMAARRQDGMMEEHFGGKKEMTSQVVKSCLKVLDVLMREESFDTTPFVDSLVSLAVTTDLSLLSSILIVLEKIEERTRNTPSPFSIFSTTTPFRGIHQSSVTKQPLPSIFFSILLSVSIDTVQALSQQNKTRSSSEFCLRPSQTEKRISLSLLLPKLKDKQILAIEMETAETICSMLEEKRASSSGPLTPADSIVVHIDSRCGLTTPQQLCIALHNIVFPEKPIWMTASPLIPLAPFFTRILKIVVPSSTDRTNELATFDENSQLVNVFLSLVLSLVQSATQSSLYTPPLSTPPLSSLLSILSIALVRLDCIPSSLDLHPRFRNMFELRENRSNPQVRQVVLALRSEGMEDRCDLALDPFSLALMNKWTGANAHSKIDRPIHNLYDPGSFPFLAFHSRFEEVGDDVELTFEFPVSPRH